MLQQTRVEAAIPYYQKFLERFPSIGALAAAPDDDVLTAWSGLGYYSRARNLHKAAKQMAERGVPSTHADVLALPGIGAYTAAAVASIAWGLPHAAVDGNVMRVISRLTGNGSDIGSAATRREFARTVETLLDPARPGDFNQAMMELGATVCLPRAPVCGSCPVSKFCAARAAGRERELPVKLRKQPARDVTLDLVLVARGSRVFLVRRTSAERRLADFWELPTKRQFGDSTADSKKARWRKIGEFRHQIVNDRFRVILWRARASGTDLPPGRWFDTSEREKNPLTTVTKKAFAAAGLFLTSR